MVGFYPTFSFCVIIKKEKKKTFSTMCVLRAQLGVKWYSWCRVLIPALWRWHSQELGIWGHRHWSETWAAGTDKTGSGTLASWSVGQKVGECGHREGKYGVRGGMETSESRKTQWENCWCHGKHECEDLRAFSTVPARHSLRVGQVTVYYSILLKSTNCDFPQLEYIHY